MTDCNRRTPRSGFLMLVLFTCMPVMPAHAGPKGVIVPPVVRTVGPGGAPCDFGSMQAAIDASSSGDIVRVVNTVNFAGAQLVISDKSLTLAGGYSSCDDTSADPNVRSIANSAGFGTVLTVSNAGIDQTQVVVRNFLLSQGNGGADHGGGVDLSGNALLRLDNVQVQGGTANYGAGVRIHENVPAAVLRLEGGSRIGAISVFASTNNAFLQGGGIHCIGGVIEWIDANITFNTAAIGGGIYMNNCSLTMPAIATGGLREVAISDNGAILAGAGIAAYNGSSLSLSSSSRRQVRIADNHSDGGSGGVYLSLSNFYGAGIHVEGNSASNLGAGFDIVSSTLSLSRGNPSGADCADAVRCSVLSRNHSESNGGALRVSNGSQANIWQTFIEENTAGTAAVALVNNSAMLDIRSSQIGGNLTSNGGGEILFASGGAIQIRNTTIALNTSAQIFRLIDSSALELADSIAWQPDATILTGDATQVIAASCVNASENVSIPAQTHDPGFVPSPGPLPRVPLLVLADHSMNLDACDEVPALNPAFDVAGQPRVTDLSAIPNAAGALDRGAFEMPESVFSDGFEATD